MTAKRAYDVLAYMIEQVNIANIIRIKRGKSPIKLWVDKTFESKYLKFKNGVYELASFSDMD